MWATRTLLVAFVAFSVNYAMLVRCGGCEELRVAFTFCTLLHTVHKIHLWLQQAHWSLLQASNPSAAKTPIIWRRGVTFLLIKPSPSSYKVRDASGVSKSCRFFGHRWLASSCAAQTGSDPSASSHQSWRKF